METGQANGKLKGSGRQGNRGDKSAVLKKPMCYLMLLGLVLLLFLLGSVDRDKTWRILEEADISWLLMGTVAVSAGAL